MVGLLATCITGFGQTAEGTEAGKGKATSIYKSLEEHNYAQASERITEYRGKFGQTAVLDYLEYLIFQDPAAPVYHMEEACRRIGSAVLHHDLIDTKDREFLCKRISFCLPEMQQLQRKAHERLFRQIRTSDEKLSAFLSSFPQSHLIGRAVTTRDSIRFTAAEKTGSVAGYEQFISQNPAAGQVKEARFRKSVLNWQVAERVNTPSAYEEFLIKEPEAPEYLKAQARLARKTLLTEPLLMRMNDTIAVFQKMLNKVYADPSGFKGEVRLKGKELEYANIRSGGRVYAARQSFDPLAKAIADLPVTAVESMAWDEALGILWRLENEIAFLAIEKASPDEAAMRAYQAKYPYAFQSRVFGSRIDFLNARKAFEQQERERIQAEEARLAEIKRKKEAEEAARRAKMDKLEQTLPMKAVSRLGESYKKEMLAILDDNYDTDPQNQAGNSCGVEFGKCEWCGNTIEFPQRLESRASTYRQLAKFSGLAEMYLGMATVMLSYGSLLSSAFSGETPKKDLPDKEMMMAEFAKEIKFDLDKIRAGEYYRCSTDRSSKYCSKKCEYEHKISKGR